MNYWPTTKNKKPTVQRVFKGINKLDPFSIKEEYATDIKNVTSSKYPSLTVAPGNALLGSAFAAKITGLSSWKNAELHVVANGAWSRWNGSAWVSLATGLNTAEYSFANFKGNLSAISLVGANGVDPVKFFDGATLANLTNAPASANYVEQYADRLWLVTAGTQLNFSGYRQATNWTVIVGDDSDPGFIIYETNNGENISAVKAGIGHLTVFKPNSISELFGYAPSDYRFVPVTQTIGAINNKCVVTINGVMYFLHKTGIFKYAGGTLPSKDFSSSVQSFIDNMNVSAVNTCSLGTDGSRLYVSIPVTSSVSPDTILEYDPSFDIWTVWNDYTGLFFEATGTAMYIGNNDGTVRSVGGTTNNGSPIAWRWVSKPFDSGSLAQRVRWDRMWVTAYVPSGSTLNVYLSKSDSGNADWELAQSVSSFGTIQGTRIMIPTTSVINANYIRYKLEGTGPCDIKEVSREEKAMPLY